MNKELLEKTLKKDLTESDLRTRLSVILCHNIDDYGLKATFGAKRLEDLLKIDYSQLTHAERLDKVRCLRSIRRDVHLYGCTLKGEFNDLNLTDEEALIPISALNISKRIKSILYRSGYIYVLGDLLSTPYHKIEQLRGMGAKNLEELNEYLESLGYSIKVTGPNIDAIKKELSESGKILIEEVIPSRKVMFALNRTGIYTLDQLLEKDLETIPGIGKVYQKEIAEYLKDYLSQDKKQDEDKNKDEELLKLSKNRDALLQRNIELRLEQQAVTEQLRQIEAEIRRKKSGVQYGKK